MDVWSIQLVGESASIERLEEALGPGDELRRAGDAVFLVRASWQNTSAWEDIEARGRSFVRSASGLLRLRGNAAEQVLFGGVARLKADGSRDYYDRGTVVTKAIVSGVEELIGPDGAPVPPPPDPLHDWLGAMDTAPELQEALRRFGGASDWFELYKVYELARQGLGGQKEVDKLLGGKPIRDRLTMTANHHRHADTPLPNNPVSFDEAVGLVGELLEIWLCTWRETGPE